MVVRKRFGQHFLEPAWVRKLVDAIAPAPTDVFVEIGPGRGAITRPLAAAARRVIAIEVDRDLAAELARTAPPNLTVVTGDVLESDFAALLPDPHEALAIRVAGNLPYNISTPILGALLAARAADERLTDATLMVQREVAERLAARPGTGEYSVLSVLVQREARIEKVLDLPPGAFRPPPKVHSSVVRLTFESRPAPPLHFAPIVRAAFQMRRKTLANALSPYARTFELDLASGLSRSGIDGRRRPETLSIDEFERLAGMLTGPA
jgi:16S rRNA (adenine1518-N6/adenine1519-N6)-dimethyltransferase